MQRSKKEVASLNKWFNHNESYNGLEIPEDIQELFKSYAEDAIQYFDD